MYKKPFELVSCSSLLLLMMLVFVRWLAFILRDLTLLNYLPIYNYLQLNYVAKKDVTMNSTPEA